MSSNYSQKVCKYQQILSILTKQCMFQVKQITWVLTNLQKHRSWHLECPPPAPNRIFLIDWRARSRSRSSSWLRERRRGRNYVRKWQRWSIILFGVFQNHHNLKLPKSKNLWFSLHKKNLGKAPSRQFSWGISAAVIHHIIILISSQIYFRWSRSWRLSRRGRSKPRTRNLQISGYQCELSCLINTHNINFKCVHSWNSCHSCHFLSNLSLSIQSVTFYPIWPLCSHTVSGKVEGN